MSNEARVTVGEEDMRFLEETARQLRKDASRHPIAKEGYEYAAAVLREMKDLVQKGINSLDYTDLFEGRKFAAAFVLGALTEVYLNRKDYEKGGRAYRVKTPFIRQGKPSRLLAHVSVPTPGVLSYRAIYRKDLSRAS